LRDKKERKRQKQWVVEEKSNRKNIGRIEVTDKKLAEDGKGHEQWGMGVVSL
jgi:hypothetical protein